MVRIFLIYIFFRKFHESIYLVDGSIWYKTMYFVQNYVNFPMVTMLYKRLVLS